MSSKILNNRRSVWGWGTLAFATLCFFCLFWHAPHFAEQSTAGITAVTTLPSARLETRLLNGKVMLTGTLPDPSAKAQLLSRARELYGDGNFVEQLKISPQTGFPQADWLTSALALLPLANQVNNEGGIALEGNILTVRGLVERDEQRAKLISDANKAAGGGINVADKVIVKGQVSSAQATDLQTKLNQALAGKIVEFDTSSDVLTGPGKAVLDEMAQALGAVPGIPVEIGGHTDARGNAALNESLSQRRARTCVRYLAEKGVDAKRLTATGYGSSKPIADNNTPDGQQRNRRIEFTVLKERK